MTPAQQEAERLIERFANVAGYLGHQCAIICVEEILKTSASEYAPEGDHWQSVLNTLKSKQ